MSMNARTAIARSPEPKAVVRTTRLRPGARVLAHWTTFHPRSECAQGVVLSADGDHCVLGLVDALDIDHTCSIDLWDFAHLGRACWSGLLARSRPGPLPRTTIAHMTILSSKPRLEGRHTDRLDARASGIIVTHEESGPWPLIDVSPAGFGMHCSRAFRRDERVNVVLTSPATQATGVVVVKHCKERAPGWFQVGVRVPPYSPSVSDFVQRTFTGLDRERLELMTALQRSIRNWAR
jgi:hypothetical protein